MKELYERLVHWFDRQAMDSATSGKIEETEAWSLLSRFAEGEQTDVVSLRNACLLTKTSIHEVIRIHNANLADKLGQRRSA